MNRIEAVNTATTIFVLAIIGAVVYFFGDIFATSEVMPESTSTIVIMNAGFWFLRGLVGAAWVTVIVVTIIFMLKKRRNQNE